MAEENNETTTWPDLAIGLFDALTGRGAEITYNFDNLEVLVPSSVSPNAPRASWKLNGAIRITTKQKA